MEHVDLTITVISWNTRVLLRECLHSIRDGAGSLRVEVHVVDNASTDGSVEMVRAEFPEAVLIVNAENIGFARANNQSWARAQGRYWMLLNPDAQLAADALETLVIFLERHPKAGLVTARLVNPDGSPQHCAQAFPGIFRVLFEASRLHKLLPARIRGELLLGPYWSYDRTIEVGWTWGTALVARREAVEGAGPLSEEFFMYGEDLEWSLRMRRAGWQIWYCAEAQVVHLGARSSAQRWETGERHRIIQDNIYRAIEMQNGRGYIRALKLSALAALMVEWLAGGLRGRRLPGITEAIAYHWQELRK